MDNNTVADNRRINWLAGIEGDVPLRRPGRLDAFLGTDMGKSMTVDEGAAVIGLMKLMEGHLPDRVPGVVSWGFGLVAVRGLRVEDQVGEVRRAVVQSGCLDELEGFDGLYSQLHAEPHS